MVIMVLTFILGTVYGVLGLIASDGSSVIRWIFGSENLMGASPKVITDKTSSKYINICLNGKNKNSFCTKQISILFFLNID